MKEYITRTSTTLKGRLPAILTVLLLIASGAAIYFYLRLHGLDSANKVSTQAEVKSLVAQVGQLMVLPQGEDPTVATVVDPEKLKDQLFFANAKKGDKVLIYSNEKKVILYDPESNKIVEVAPVNIGNPPVAASSTPTNTRPLAPKKK